MYTRVNAALNGIFLDGRFSSRPIYLVLDNAARLELAGRLGIDESEVEKFCCAKVGESFVVAGDPFRTHWQALDSWERAGQASPPPFTALLFVLAHAAEHMVSDENFSAGNYYSRLAELTGVERQRLSQYGKSTEKFWTAFSRWLAATDYAFGRPTARQQGSMRYVSLAVSQVAVRAADRECFHHLFKKYGFSGTDIITQDEVSHYISTWIHSGAPTKRVKAAWTKPELRPRICEVALAELEAWTDLLGHEPGEGGETGSRLSLAVELVLDFPSRRLAISMGRKAEMDMQLRRPSEAGTQYSINNSRYGTFATVSPARALDIATVLQLGVDFDAWPSGARLSWRPRDVLPFSRSESGAYWMEVNRTTLGVEHMVLARAGTKIRQAVESILSESAAPGFSVVTHNELKGLPQDWVLYERVRMVRLADHVTDEMRPLSPVGDTSGIQVIGGLPLLRNIWHSWVPPRITLDADDTHRTRIEVHEGIDEAGPRLAATQETQGSASLDLLDHKLPDSGSLFVQGFMDGAVVGSTSLLLRSAARPRPIHRQSAGRLVFQDINAASPEGEQGDAAPGIRGLRVACGMATLADQSSLPRFVAISSGGEDEKEQPDMLAMESSVARPKIPGDGGIDHILQLSCAERGCHYWHAEMVPPGQPKSAPISMTCKLCSHSMLARNRGKKKSAKPGGLEKPPPPARLLAPRTPEAFQRPSKADLDLVFDALCFLGSGTWGGFETVVASQLDDPWEATSIAAGLVALGHMDVGRQRGSGRIQAWSIPAPTLTFVDAGVAFFSGFRNIPLLEEAATLLANAGGKLSKDILPRQPARVVVTCLGQAEASIALEGLKDPLGRGVLVNDEGARKLAGACQAMHTPWSLLSDITPGAADRLEAYDLLAGKWRSCARMDKPGAYRFQHAGQVYVFRDGSGRCMQGPHETIKLLAARSTGTNLHCYSASERMFTSRLGCDPPLLLRRALVACSGVLPSISGGMAIYRDVPPDVAATVLAVMYEGDMPP